MSSLGYCVILFPSMSDTLRAEKTLKRQHIAAKLIPVPRELSSDCGVCLRFECQREAEVRVLLDQDGLQPDGHISPVIGCIGIQHR